MSTKQAKIKNLKKISIVKLSTLSLVGVMLLSSLGGCAIKQNDKDNVIDNTRMEDKAYEYRSLEELRKVKLSTYIDTFKEEDGSKKKYHVVEEQDVLELSREFRYATKDYFKSYGASNWTNEDTKQFWPKDIEYMVTAIAYRESTYRTDSTNKERDCVGMMGINKNKMVPTLEQWLTSYHWAPNYPQVEYDVTKVDMFNPTTSMEYTYYNIGYNLINFFKKDKYFTDKDGKYKTIWTTLKYSEDMQNRLIIASHLFGIDNVVDSIYDRNYDEEQKRYISLDEYIYSDYVEDVLDKMYELKNTYEQEQGLSR